LKATNRLILIYSAAVISAVYIASQSAYWQLVLCTIGIVYSILLINNPKRITLYLVIPLFLLAMYRASLDLTRYQRMQSFAQKEEIRIIGKVIDLYDNTCIVEAENINREKVKGNVRIWSSDGFDLEIGDKIIADINPQVDTKPKFYGAFDNIKQNLSLHQYIFGFSKSYEVINKSNSFMKWIYEFRQNMKDRFAQLFPEAEANMAKALFFGDTSGFDNQTKQEVQDSGASHIFAISGQNLSIISLIVMLLLGKICKGSKTKNIISITAIVLFTILVGYSASVLRSAIMIIKYLSEFLVNRRDEPIDSVFFSVIIVLLLFPFALFTPNFLLSYSAVLGILLLASPFLKVEVKWKRLWGMVLSGIAAVMASSIFLAYFFKAVNLTSIWSSVILEPVVTLALCGILLISIFPFLASLFTGITYLCLHYTYTFIEKLSATKVIIYTGTPQFIEIICFGFIIYFMHVIIEKGIVPWLNNQLKES